MLPSRCSLKERVQDNPPPHLRPVRPQSTIVVSSVFDNGETDPGSGSDLHKVGCLTKKWCQDLNSCAFQLRVLALAVTVSYVCDGEVDSRLFGKMGIPHCAVGPRPLCPSSLLPSQKC